MVVPLVVRPFFVVVVVVVVCTWNINIGVKKVSFGYRFMVVCWATASVFLVVRRPFWLSRVQEILTCRIKSSTFSQQLLSVIGYIIMWSIEGR